MEGQARHGEQVDDSFMGISKEAKERFRTTMTQMIEIIRSAKHSDGVEY